MAYSAPSSRSTSDLITAAIWNADVVANPIAIYAGAMSVTSQAVGDILYASSTTQFARIAAVATGQVLTSAGTGTVPAWSSNVSLGGTLDVAGAVTFNDAGADVDFRVETSANANALNLTSTGLGIFRAADLDYYQTIIAGSFTSGGASSVAAGLITETALTAHSGDTTRVTGQSFTSSITTPAASFVVALMAQTYIKEPNITLGSGSTVTNAASLYIADAPTEGGTGNFALWVDAGATQLDGTLTVGGAITGAIDGIVGGTTPAAGTFTQVDITAEGDLRLQDNTGGQYVGLDAPATVSGSYTLTMPAAIGSVNQMLTINNTDGTLQWATPSTFDTDAAQVFNESGADVDFRVETDGDTHALIVNGGTNNVGIGEADPSAKFVVNGTGGTTAMLSEDTSGELVAVFQPGSGGHADRQGNIYVVGTDAGHNDSVALISAAGTSVDMLLATRRSDGTADTNMILKGDSGFVGVNTVAPEGTLHVESGSAGSITFQGASDDLIVEHSNHGGITVATPADKEGSLMFLGPTTTDLGIIAYAQATPGLQFHVANAKIATITAHGIAFNADTADANALDDYEQGTWTPVPKGSGGSAGSHNVSNFTGGNIGEYTKIGRQVTVTCYGSITDKGDWTGNAEVHGLPYTVGNQASNGCLGAYPAGEVDAAFRTVHVPEGGTKVVFKKGSRLDYAEEYSDIDAGYYLMFTASYWV